MLIGVREFLRTKGGKSLGIGVTLVALVVMIYSVKANFGESEAEAMASTRWFVCTETGKGFKHKLKSGETFPIYSSYSGKNTALPAETCYWTKDGKPKDEPTAVLLKEPSQPTFCPDCGRLVTAYNPRPGKGVQPPPLQSEYKGRPRRAE
jgi:hypothetical protein